MAFLKKESVEGETMVLMFLKLVAWRTPYLWAKLRNWSFLKLPDCRFALPSKFWSDLRILKGVLEVGCFLTSGLTYSHKR